MGSREELKVLIDQLPEAQVDVSKDDSHLFLYLSFHQLPSQASGPLQESAVFENSVALINCQAEKRNH